MARTSLFRQALRHLRLAQRLEAQKVPTREGLERLESAKLRRRELLAAGGAGLAATALSGCVGQESDGATTPLRRDLDVGVVGAGLAGLSCADALAGKGLVPTVYEAADRIGGRCFSMGGAFGGPFPGQVAERGGEYIDTTHQTMRGFARRFGLTLEEVTKDPGEVFYYFDGTHHDEAAVVDEFRVLVDALRDDLRTLGSPTAQSFTDADRALDLTTLADYLQTRAAHLPLVRQVLDVAYTIEYGLEVSEQSALNLLFFLHADRRSHFRPFGVFSDERFHVVEGNQSIALGLAADLPREVQLGRTLESVRKRSDGRVELGFEGGFTAVHDAVVITLPFSVLRHVALDASLGLPEWKTRAITELRYGTNAKHMLSFTGRPWEAQGSNGTAYADLPELQCTWETNAALADATRAILTDYSGGNRGASLDPRRPSQEAEAFLADLERVYPGVSSVVRRDERGRIVSHLEHWPSNPLSRGSYTCNHPGYFTEIGGLEGLPVDNLFFAGEHTDSFYEWQGFMEGACLSGLRVADEIGRAFRR